MKRVICLALLALSLNASAVPCFGQYRKPASEMTDQELEAAIQYRRDTILNFTKRTRSILSSHVGQEISLGLDGSALIMRYYPNTLAWAQEKLNSVLAEPGFIPKLTNGGKEDEGGGGSILKPAQIARDVGIFLWSTISWMDEIAENNLERDLMNIYRDPEQYPNDRIEAMVEQIDDQVDRDLADALRHNGYRDGALVLDLMLFIETGIEWQRRKQLRQYLFPNSGQGGGRLRDTPNGHDAPRGWITGKPGGNGSAPRGNVTLGEPGCVEITYAADGQTIVSIRFVPCS